MRSGGFALISVMLLVAVVALTATILLDVLRADVMLGGLERSLDEARAVAEGGVMEVIDDRQTPDLLPTHRTPELRAEHSGGGGVFAASGQGTYEAEIELLRIVPLSESSINQTRAVVYEVTSIGTSNRGEERFEVRTEIFRPVAIQRGVVLPRRHAR